MRVIGRVKIECVGRVMPEFFGAVTRQFFIANYFIFNTLKFCRVEK